MVKEKHYFVLNIFLNGEREELNKITTGFQWLKLELGINKTELYKKALLWIVSDEKIKQKFIEYLLNEKAENSENSNKKQWLM